LGAGIWVRRVTSSATTNLRSYVSGVKTQDFQRRKILYRGYFKKAETPELRADYFAKAGAADAGPPGGIAKRKKAAAFGLAQSQAGDRNAKTPRQLAPGAKGIRSARGLDGMERGGARA